MPAKNKASKKAVKKTAKKVAAKAAKKPPGKAVGKSTAKSAKKVGKKAVKKAVAKQASKTVAGKKPVAKGDKKEGAKGVVTKKADPKSGSEGASKAKADQDHSAKLTQFVKRQHKRLLDLRDELMDAMYGVQQETLRNGPSGSEASGSGMHQGDAGSDAYDRDFALNLLAKEQDALQEIQAALGRIEAGTYGICEISGHKIPQARLEAIPFARLTVECQSQWEQEHPHRQFRTSDAIGFLGGVNGLSLVSLDQNDD